MHALLAPPNHAQTLLQAPLLPFGPSGSQIQHALQLTLAYLPLDQITTLQASLFFTPVRFYCGADSIPAVEPGPSSAFMSSESTCKRGSPYVDLLHEQHK